MPDRKIKENNNIFTFKTLKKKTHFMACFVMSKEELHVIISVKLYIHME